MPVLVKKLAKRPVSKVSKPEVVSVQVVRRGYNNSSTFRSRNNKVNLLDATNTRGDLCGSRLIECDVFNKTRAVRRLPGSGGDSTAEDGSVSTDTEGVATTTSDILSFLPESFAPLVEALR